MALQWLHERSCTRQVPQAGGDVRRARAARYPKGRRRVSGTPLSPAQRKLRAQIAANARWAKEPDRLAATAPGRRAAFEKLLDEVDPGHQLSETERTKRAENLQRSNLLRLSLQSSKARQLGARHNTGPDFRSGETSAGEEYL